MKLQVKIIATVLFITLTVNIMFQYNLIRLQKKISIQNLNAKIEKTNQLLSNINSVPMFYFDTQLIKTNMESFLLDKEIRSIYILESSGEIDLYIENKEISNENLIEVSQDISHDNEIIGRVIVSYTQNEINKKLKESISMNIISIIASTIIIVFILLLLIKQIIKPIEELTELTHEISNGNLDKEIIIRSNDEVGRLSLSFLRMRDSIKEKIQSLNIENEERKKAENALTIKTNELANANKELLAHRIHLEELVKNRTSELQDTINTLNDTKNQLVESEKMASLGDLVAGVAHEINTPVGIGVTAASHLETETKKLLKSFNNQELSKSQVENYIALADESSKMILSNMIRAANLIQSFKMVAVDQSSEEKRVFELKSYINEVLLSMNSKFKHTKYKVIVSGSNNIVLDSYPGALAQVLTNLIINSLIHGFEKMDSGTIEIKLEEINNKARIVYSDTGVGIPPGIQNRVFDPFFTTKRGNGGSGLGMNIVYNLVKQTLKGSISFKSSVGEGTIFIIDIPLKL